MIPGRGEGRFAAGGPARHIPVLLPEVLAALEAGRGGAFVDGTFGAGGYTRGILAEPGTSVLAIDRDPDAIAAGHALVAESAGRLRLVHGRFGALDQFVAEASQDGVVLDIGVSSMQLDEAARGFSFRHDGPLDMRMGQDGPTAADLVNSETPERLADILFQFGEERASRRIARAVVHDRITTPFTSTAQLAGLVARLLPGKPGDIHPATRTFQALRIAVNDELGELARALSAAERVLKPGGRLVVVSFHSLEDRIVKQFFADRSGRGAARSRLLPGEPVPPAPTFTLSGRQPVAATETEARSNPRARSAKLRAAIRTDAPPRGDA